MVNKSNIILVCGGSCSGKTTLASGIGHALLDFGTVELISMDDYYKDVSRLDEATLHDYNFDCPEAIDFALCLNQLKKLISGQPAPRQSYDFSSHAVTRLPTQLKPATFIIVEGIFALYFEELRKLAAASLFIHADADIRLAKRVLRDSHKRGATLGYIIKQYLNDVRPMHNQYIEPYSKYADIVLDSGVNSIDKNLHMALDFLNSKLLHC
ncbi:MAG: uridine kinase [Victivallaceae bacterium]